MDQCSQEAEMSRSPLLESEWTRRPVLKTSLSLSSSSFIGTIRPGISDDGTSLLWYGDSYRSLWVLSWEANERS